MSVTGHRDVRHPDDFYETPAWCVRALLPYLQRGTVLDPCCGNGAIGRVLAEEWPEQERYGIEIDETRAGEAKASQILRADGTPMRAFDKVSNCDYLKTQVVDQLPNERVVLKPAPLIITNPPFKLALEFATKAIKDADTVAFLLRLNWLASETRRAFHAANPSDLVIMPRRPSFAQFCSCTVCAWKATLPASAERPSWCPECIKSAGGHSVGKSPIKVSTTDSTEYAWFVWGPGRGGRYEIAGNRHPIDWAQVKRDLEVGAAAIDAAEGA
jgi:hypothetical protein